MSDLAGAVDPSIQIAPPWDSNVRHGGGDFSKVTSGNCVTCQGERKPGLSLEGGGAIFRWGRAKNCKSVWWIQFLPVLSSLSI